MFIWFSVGSALVQHSSRFGAALCGLIVYSRGSEVVQLWFSVVWPECIRSSFGSDVVQLWFGHGSAVVGPMLIQLCVA